MTVVNVQELKDEISVDEQPRPQTTLLSRSDLLGRSTRRFKNITVLGCNLRIQSLSESEMIAVRESFVDRKGSIVRSRSKRIQQILVSRCLVDDAGKRLFSDDDVFSGVMDQIDGGVVAGAFAACKEHTGFAADEDWAAIEDAGKNS